MEKLFKHFAESKAVMAVIYESKKHETKYVTITSDEYESMKSTIEVLSDKELMKQIQESKKAVVEGKVKKWDDLKKELEL